jgi:LPXTG-motif cell wall-anchored protein
MGFFDSKSNSSSSAVNISAPQSATDNAVNYGVNSATLNAPTQNAYMATGRSRVSVNIKQNSDVEALKAVTDFANQTTQTAFQTSQTALSQAAALAAASEGNNQVAAMMANAATTAITGTQTAPKNNKTIIIAAIGGVAILGLFLIFARKRKR